MVDDGWWMVDDRLLELFSIDVRVPFSSESPMVDEWTMDGG